MYKMIFRNSNNYKCITGGELYHHGILGQKWGVRRYQKKDGSLTAAGKKRYSDDEASFDELAMEQAKKDGLDDGDNYKVYKKAMMGDKRAKAIIEQWKEDKEENDYYVKTGNFKRDKYGDYSYTTKNGIRVNFEDQNLSKEANQIVNALTSENLSKISEEIAKMASKDKWNYENIPIEKIKNNLRMYNCRIVDKGNNGIGLDVSFEHKNMFDDSAIFGDHSIDYDAVYDTKTKQFKLGAYSING